MENTETTENNAPTFLKYATTRSGDFLLWLKNWLLYEYNGETEIRFETEFGIELENGGRYSLFPDIWTDKESRSQYVPGRVMTEPYIMHEAKRMCKDIAAYSNDKVQHISLKIHGGAHREGLYRYLNPFDMYLSLSAEAGEPLQPGRCSYVGHHIQTRESQRQQEGTAFKANI